ncbi:myosin regulatory light polypeptide 9-like isoform X1 [Pteronotus mesoamericanus]|uniref:myosin regulatory light polypeptide 9-like isoform X1 n=1 Tax=Pteronotus mesoamericanus TaxID=1884717 RepID=UPI0023ECF217|nr:myosin regulatory light polypeptide 9-like isoform X1 [Pteronotus parnellii mesoamericanus]
MSSKKTKTKTTNKCPQHATSNVFSMFDQSQIQESKEAFHMIDQNRGGFIDKEDLHDVLASLGNIQEDYLRELLTTMGGRFTDEEVDELYREAPIDKNGNFNYIEFTQILKHGAKDKDD